MPSAKHASLVYSQYRLLRQYRNVSNNPPPPPTPRPSQLTFYRHFLGVGFLGEKGTLNSTGVATRNYCNLFYSRSLQLAFFANCRPPELNGPNSFYQSVVLHQTYGFVQIIITGTAVFNEFCLHHLTVYPISNHGVVITDYGALVEKNKRGGGGSDINSDGVFKVRRSN